MGWGSEADPKSPLARSIVIGKFKQLILKFRSKKESLTRFRVLISRYLTIIG